MGHGILKQITIRCSFINVIVNLAENLMVHTLWEHVTKKTNSFALVLKSIMTSRGEVAS